MRRPIAIFAVLSSCVLSAFSQSYQKHIFKTVPFGGGGCVTGIVTCPTKKNLIFARTDVGGVWRWVESTKSWKSLHFAAPRPGMLCVESLAIDPSSPNRIYCVAGQGYFDSGATTLMRSLDYGESWELVDVTSHFKANGNATGKGTGERLRVDPNKGNILYFGSRTTGLWKSIDCGSTWSKVGTFPVKTTALENGIHFVEFVTETVNRIYRSDDSGLAWVRLTDDTQQFGGAQSNELLIGDMNTYGRVYFANCGIGLVYGDIVSRP